MTDSSTEKIKLMSMLGEIHDQLTELESVLEVSFSDHRKSLNQNSQEKLSDTANKLFILENKFALLTADTAGEKTVQTMSHKVRNLKWAFK